jgi:8-oxo-dGTP diphosphatase
MDELLELKLYSERLVLRAPEEGDVPAFVRWCGDWELARWTANIPHPYTHADGEKFVGEARRAFVDARTLTFAFERLEAPGLIGTIGLGLDGAGEEADMGWWVGGPFQGQGYASEAASCVVDFARTMGLHRLTAGTHPDNLVSQSVARKLGMRPAGRLLRAQPARGHPAETLEFVLTL